MPIIALCANWNSQLKRSDMPNDYVTSIILAGGTPIIIPITDEKKALLETLDIVDGIVFTGGSDVNPKLYGEDTRTETEDIVDLRDSQEILLIKEAIKRDLPFIGICRGIQIINVAEGGSLYQDIKQQLNKEINHARFDIPRDIIHKVDIKQGTLLSKIIGKISIEVNSRHHQAVKELPSNMQVSAISEDGIIEGIEYTDGTKGFAVQWHPESMLDKTEESLEIYKWLVDEAKKYSKEKHR